MTKQVLYFQQEPRGLQYRELLDWLLDRSQEFSLIVRDSLLPGSTIAAALEKLRPWRISIGDVSEWPGTKILGSATQYRHRCSPSPAYKLAELSDGLFDWEQPRLPEDLSFADDAGRALLVTIAHEREAYLDLTHSEEEDLRAALPNIYGGLLRKALAKEW